MPVTDVRQANNLENNKMSDNANANSADPSAGEENQGPFPAVSNPCSNQPTSLVETTFAETLGLSMHNAVTSQQSSQMTTAASITNACARLLQASKLPPAKEKDEETKDAQADEAAAQTPMTADKKDAPPAKRKFNIMNFMKSKKKSEQPQQSNPAEDAAEAVDEVKTDEEPGKS